MALLLEGAHIVDPQVGLDGPASVLVRDGRIVEVGAQVEKPAKCVVRDLSGCHLFPGLVDAHVHFRDPGLEYKEDILSGMRAAARGGFTAVAPMANTKPVIDTGALVAYELEKCAWEPGRTRVVPVGACTKGLAGAELAEMGDMAQCGAAAFSDDGRGIQDSGTMRRVMDYAKMLGRPVLSHCQDEGLVAGGVADEGAVSTALGLAAWPAAGEEVQIARDVELAHLTGCRLHVQHVTTARGVEIVARAKADGVPVTCEATPHHLFLDSSFIKRQSYDTDLKVNPPLRSAADARALQEALLDGTIDMVSTDHAPHAAHEKALEFNLAPFGTAGLETALAAVLTCLVSARGDGFDAAEWTGLAPARMGLARLVEAMAIAPRKLLGCEPVRIERGGLADFTVVDLDARWTVDAADFASKGKNSAFLGKHMRGRVVETYTAGYATFQDGEVTF